MSLESQFSEEVRSLSRERLALLATQLHQQLQAHESRRREPLAIVGMACRFAGAPSVDAYWNLLSGGVDAIAEVPEERKWDKARYFDPRPGVAGKMYVWEGGFLERAEWFDAPFFGVSPREALRMDPQQRLLLETVWQAMDQGGQSLRRLQRGQTGVYLGISTNDFLQLGCRYGDADQIDPYTGTGTAASIAAGRVSYSLGLSGPNFPVDTACSSSLVALHLAAQSLRSGEIDSAVVAGVNLALSPETTVYFCQVRALSPDGRCKTFDASANGYVRSEGVAAIVLKRLSDAIAERDHILAVVRGTAINHDGRTSGLTVPNGASQERLIRQALRDADLAPEEIGYLEAHGTGTPLGDPIEVQSLGKVFAATRPSDRPLLLGSCKTNIGHCEAAAGLAGLIKVVLSLGNGRIPPHLHLHHPNPAIPWARLPFEAPRELVDWPSGETRRAGVSSFGFSGTNAHVVLEEAPAPARVEPTESRPHLLCVSGRSKPALQAAATELLSRLEREAPRVDDLCFTASAGRSQFNHRLAAAVSGPEEAKSSLKAFLAGESPPVQVDASTSPKVAFLMTGQGSQYVGMGEELFPSQATFRAALLECAEALAPHLDRPLRSVLFASEGATDELLRETRYAQPALFAVEYALGKMWMAWGVQPAVLLGHSIGEYAAATLAGVFSLADAARLVAQRAALMHGAPGRGTMLALRTTEAIAAELIAPFADRASIAAINAPQNVVVSGCVDALSEVAAACQAQKIAAQPLAVSHAFHSPLMAPIVEAFRRCFDGVALRPPEIGLVSDATGKLVRDEVADPDYWCRQLVQPVRFADGVQTLCERGYEAFLETGPAPTLVSLGRQTAPTAPARWLPSLRPRVDAWKQLVDTLRELYLAGVEVDWDAVYEGTDARKTPLPEYPFQRQRFAEPPQAERSAAEASLRKRLSPPTEATPELQPTTSESVDEPAVDSGGDHDLGDPSDWVYDLAWTDAPFVDEDWERLEPGSWLIFIDDAGVGAAIAELLEGRGDRVYRVTPSDADDLEQVDADRWRLNPDEPSHYVELLRKIAAEDQTCRGILHLWSALASGEEDEGSFESSQRLGCRSLFHLARALATAATPGSPRLTVATRGGQTAPGDALPPAAEQAPVWGLSRVIAVEQPHLRPLRIDLNAASTDPICEATAVLRSLAAPDYEDQIALRRGRRFALRMRPRGDVFSSATSFALAADAAYWITGGLGGLGLKIAQWAVRHGARTLFLTSRSAPSEQAALTLDELRQTGANVYVLQGDVADRGDVERMLVEIAACGSALRGVIHAAGVLDDVPLTQLDWSRFEQVMRPKVQGTWELHRATRETPLDFFVCFSSIVAVMGSPHQANYAAANAYQDALMARRRATGLPGAALNWGPWAEEGMAARLGEGHRRTWTSLGVAAFAPEQGCDLLGRMLGGDDGQYVLIRTDWARFLQIFPPGLEPPLLKDLVRQRRQPTPPSAAWTEMLARLETAPTSQHAAIVGEYVEAIVAEALGVDDPRSLDPQAGLFDLGMDSLMAVELRLRLQTDVGFSHALPITFVFDQPTIHQIAAWLVKEAIPGKLAEQRRDRTVEKEALPRSNAGPEPSSTERAVPSQPARRVAPVRSEFDDDAVALVGIGCRYPGGIDDPESFWQALAEGRDCIREVPPNRWDADAWYDPDPDAPGKMNTRYGGFLDDVEQFDAAYFGVSPREALRMDPQHRLLLETTVHALEHAHQPLDGLFDQDVGVFVGLSGNDYLDVLRRGGDGDLLDGWLATGNALSIAAGRLSHVFGFRGPCLAIDTACSSSLAAVHLACDHLRAGKTSLAIAGGVGLILSPGVTVSLTKARAMAPDGRCKTFDAAANGYTRSEGCGLVVLKRMSDALADGDRILAVIRGSAMNHDGHGSGVTVPNGAAQTSLLRDALAAANTTPAEVDYLEAHGTGTPLGDPIELQAIGAAYGPGHTAEAPLRIGSVKTNLGHTEAAAGVAGLIKTVLAMQHEEIPQHLHFRQPNPFVPWDQLPVQVARERTAWPATGRPRIAGVSSFGFSGTNVHLVVEAAPNDDAQAPSTPKNAPRLLCLSGKTTAAVRKAAGRAAELLRDDPSVIDDLAFSAHRGRTHHAQRRAFCGDTPAALLAALEAATRDEGAGDVEPTSPRRSPRPVFVFDEHVVFDRESLQMLGERYGAFREAIAACDHVLTEQGIEPILATPERNGRAATAANSAVLQFLGQFAAARLWRGWGVEPQAVAGRGLGEIVAACVADVASLADGLLAARLYDESVSAALAVLRGRTDADALERTTLLLSSGEICTRETLNQIGAGGDSDENRVAEALHRLGGDLVLGFGEEKSSADQTTRLHALPAAADEATRLRSLGALYERGVPIDWRAFHADYPGRWIDLPGYPFERERYWPETDGPFTPESLAAGAGLAPATEPSDDSRHPVLGRLFKSPALRGAVHERTYSDAAPRFVRDHRIHSLTVLPGASHLSTALAAAALEGDGPLVLRDVSFPEALILDDGEHRVVQTLVEPGSEAGIHEFRVMSESPERGDKWLLHARGRLVPADDATTAPEAPLPKEIQGRCESGPFDCDRFYEAMNRSGVQLGPSFQWNREFWRRDRETLSRMVQPVDEPEIADYVLFPGLVDSCIQLIAPAIPASKRDNAAYIPVHVEELRCFGPPSERMWCHFTLRDDQAADGVYVGDWTLFDDDRRVIASAIGLRYHRAPRTALLAFARRRFRDWLYRLDWIEQPAAVEAVDVSAAEPRAILVLGAGGESAALADALTEVDSPDAVVAVDLAGVAAARADGDSVNWLAGTMEERLPVGCDRFTDVVFLAGDDGRPEQWLAGAGRSSLQRFLEVAQSLAKLPLRECPRLTAATSSSQAATGETKLNVSASPLWGFARVLALELPQLRCLRIDLDADAEAKNQAASLLAEIRRGGPEDQVALRGDSRYVARLLPGLPTGRGAGGPAQGQPYRLEKSDRGVIEDLAFRPLSRLAPEAGEIEIAVQATGLNFRDVLNAVNLYPGEAGPLGVECAGVVAAVGPGVSRFQVGDRVTALAPGCFNQYVVTDARLAAKLPENVSLSDGAGLPVVFLTAEYALRRLAKLSAGETLLIHSAAGGVGHAALEIARRVGARVIATAGTPTKRDFLKAKGIEHVFDSRSLDFADGVLEATGGAGVDVVLNFTPGEAIPQNLRALKPRGRFVEIGKVDIWDAKRMAQARPDVDYHVLALDELAIHQPQLIEELFAELMQDFGEEVYAPPTSKEFELASVQDAFRYMAQGQHIGKILVAHPPVDAAATAPERTIRADRTWLLTGGLGALGLQSARMLAEAGVPRLVLAARRPPSAEAQAVVEEIREAGCEVWVRSVDAAERTQVDELLAEIDAGGPPLGGVMHLAGVLDDGVIANLNWERCVDVMRPKVLGAWNLDQATRKRDLDAFVLFSSAASLLGSPGQANYATANAYLDALAHARRAAGLPGVSINWGPWAEQGMADRTAAAHRQWESMGLSLLTAADGMEVLHIVLESDAPQVGVLPIDWKKLLALYGAGGEPRVLAAIAGRHRAAAEPSKEWLALVEKITEAPPAERVGLLVKHIQQESAAVLGLDPSQPIDPHAPLSDLGFDSLMAVELANRFTSASGVSLSLTMLFDYPTVHAMSEYIVRKVLQLDTGQRAAPEMLDAAAGRAGESVETMTASLLDSLEKMSDEEVRRGIEELEPGS